MEGIGKTRAFLTELIIVILFFSLAAVITLQLFLAAADESNLSTVKTNAHLKMQMIAEEVRGHGVYIDSLFSEANGWYNGTRYYNGDFVLCAEEDAEYVLTVKLTKDETEAGVMSHVSLEMCSTEQEQLGKIAVSVYEPKWRDVQ